MGQGKEFLKKYQLEDYEKKWLIAFMETHSVGSAMKVVESEEKEKISASLNSGDNALSNAFSRFVASDPPPPMANKLSILNALGKALQICIEDEDTAGIVRVSQEINKMIKGNLAGSDVKKSPTTLVGIIDMSKGKSKALTEGRIIDVEFNQEEDESDVQ